MLVVSWCAMQGSARAQLKLGSEVLVPQAAAAKLMIIQAVQQAISALPPTSGQAVLWEFLPAMETPVRSKELGPTVLRAVETVGKGHFNLRIATSYFELSDTFGPIPYSVRLSDQDAGYVKFGVATDATVGLLNFSASYGLGQKLEFSGLQHTPPFRRHTAKRPSKHWETTSWVTPSSIFLAV
jgi:hypothetical protein